MIALQTFVTHHSKRKYFFDFLFLSLCISTSLFSAFFWSTKGLALWDTSYITDPAFRIAQGQIPYRDFWIIPLPFTFLVQGFLYKLFGNWLIISVIYIGLQNGIAAYIIFKTLYLFLPHRYAVIFGFLNNFWYVMPFGFPFYDLDAYFFIIIGIYLLLKILIKQKQGSNYLPFLLGLSSGFAFLAKQNIGLGAFVLFPLAFIINFHSLKKVGKFLLSFIVGAIIPIVITVIIFFSLGALPQMISWTFGYATSSKGGSLEIIGRLWYNIYSSFTNIVSSYTHFQGASLMITFPLLLGLLFYWKPSHRDSKSTTALGLIILMFFFVIFQRLSIPNAALRFNTFYVGGTIGCLTYLCKKAYPGLSHTFYISVFFSLYFCLAINSNNLRIDNAWLGTTYQTSLEQYHLQSPALRGFSLSEEIGSGLDEAIAYVNTNFTTEEDTFVVFPIDNFIHFATAKPAVIPVVQFYPGLQVFPEQQEYLVSEYLSKTKWLFRVKKYQEEERDDLLVDGFYKQLPVITDYFDSQFILHTSLQTYDLYLNKSYL